MCGDQDQYRVALAEAIVWHGGEAKPARDRFVNMSKEDREALLAFINAL